MPLATITEYLAQIDRVGRLWFFHENLASDRGDSLWGVPGQAFPPMQEFSLVASSPSRWPRYGPTSKYACRENLFLRTNVLREA